MSNLTYEFENRIDKLETYEWDNVWWEHADEEGTPRVLYIGDSISVATRSVATATSENAIYFDGLGTSKALDNPHFPDTVRLFARQEGKRRAVLFNNGLHGWHLDDESEYAKYYEEMIKFLVTEFRGTPVYLVLTSAVADPERDARVVKRNAVVLSLAEKYAIPVIDYYSIVNDHRDLICPDGVHLLPDGYKLLAEKLVSVVKEVIK
jgi:hypothetical protein